MSAFVNSSPSPPSIPKPKSRSLKGLSHSVTAVNENTVAAKLPEIKDRSSVSENVQPPFPSLQNNQNDFIPDEILSSLTSNLCTRDRLEPSKISRTPKHLKVGGLRAPDAVWHHYIGRKKYQYFLDQPVSLSGAGRDISFLCDTSAAQKQKISLPPMPDSDTTPSQDPKTRETLIPTEYHIVKKKGVKPLQLYDDKFTVLLQDDDNKLSVFPSMKPSGRLEAVQLMRLMDDMLEKAGINQEFEELTGLSQMQELLELVQVEQKIYNIVFHELIRQVSVECAERGQLLAKLRQRYAALLDRIPRQLRGLHTETLAQKALDWRLTEEIICFKKSVAHLTEELSELREHDVQVVKQTEKSQEELAKALEQSQRNSDMVGEFHHLYELQRQRLEKQVASLTEEKDLWSKITYSLALKVINVNNLQLVSRLHVSEQTWNATAEHFIIVLTAKDSEELNQIMELTDEWKEQLSSFMENRRLTERKQCEGIRSIQTGISTWKKFFETTRNPDAKSETISEEKLFNDLKQWSKVLTVQCERYGGEDLLSGQETLKTLVQLQESWEELFLQLFRRHSGPDGEPPQGQAAMRELCHTVTELHKQLGTRINGESGIHKQLMTLVEVMDFWTNKLKSLIGSPNTLPHSDALKLEEDLCRCLTLAEEAILNVDCSQPESEKIEQKPHSQFETDDVLEKLREFLTSQNNFFECENFTLGEKVRSLHKLRIHWMVDLLLLMVPDCCNTEEHRLSPDTEFYSNKEASPQKLEEDARNLAQKSDYLSKYIISSCHNIVEEMIQRNTAQDEVVYELYQLKKLENECSEWADVCRIVLSDLPGFPVELQLSENAVSIHPGSSRSGDIKPKCPAEAKDDEKADGTNEQVEVKRTETITDNEKKGFVLKLIGHDGYITEQIIGDEMVQLPGTSDLVTRPQSENAQHAFSALATVRVLQQELLAVETRAIRAEERAMKAEDALQGALEKIYELERNLPQETSPETTVSKKSASPVANTEPTSEPREVSQKPMPSPKPPTGSKKH
ncbi:LOW QUALITY PROTEIN: axonemal dynein light chain domain-containing protein 1 [Trichomycterus rosablanca]|uniref:LOW QUALITY PROTEIN: axonemal dynein light chain domain-containing protein 1 n=1 Tax=Trichomycterus rosablanca TaxID=2290929 RepID=UPI002F35DD59